MGHFVERRCHFSNTSSPGSSATSFLLLPTSVFSLCLSPTRLFSHLSSVAFCRLFSLPSVPQKSPLCHSPSHTLVFVSPLSSISLSSVLFVFLTPIHILSSPSGSSKACVLCHSFPHTGLCLTHALPFFCLPFSLLLSHPHSLPFLQFPVGCTQTLSLSPPHVFVSRLFSLCLSHTFISILSPSPSAVVTHSPAPFTPRGPPILYSSGMSSFGRRGDVCFTSLSYFMRGESLVRKGKVQSVREDMAVISLFLFSFFFLLNIFFLFL